LLTRSIYLMALIKNLERLDQSLKKTSLRHWCLTK
jgi:hypothetical protein